MRNRSVSAAFKFLYDHKSTKNILFRHIFIQKNYFLTHFYNKTTIKVNFQSSKTKKSANVCINLSIINKKCVGTRRKNQEFLKINQEKVCQ